MAVVEVGTWADLVTQLAVSNNTVKLANDIDCNDEIPMGVASSVTVASDFDGQGHTIRNLRSHLTSPVTIFKTSGPSEGTRTFRNIDFVNLILDKGNGADIVLIQSNFFSSRLNITNCRFVGRRNTYLMDVLSGGYTPSCYITSCYFHVPNYGAVKYQQLFET